MACQQTAVSPTVWPTAILPSAVDEAMVEELATAVSPTVALPEEKIKITAVSGTPTELITILQAFVQNHPGQYEWVDAGEADVVITPNGERPFAQWVYAVAAPFATIQDNITAEELRALWQAPATNTIPLFVQTNDLDGVSRLLGTAGENVQAVPLNLSEAVWAERLSLAIVPFDQLTPDLKVLTVDGNGPIQKAFNAAAYPLILRLGLAGEETAVNQFLADWDGPSTNRDASKMTTVAMTGVTAFVRATAFNMEQFGVLWPGEEVAPILQQADIAHLSNEVSFDPECPYPNPIGGTSFCSSDAYFALIENLSIDVIELTGNHLNDYGRINVDHSMNMYEDAGMQTFGGGRNLAEAARPALFEHNGNKVAFVGCNDFGPTYAWATETDAGSRPCDDTMPAEISGLNDEGYVVITTLQYAEFYHYAATEQQKLDFQALINAGATAVSGSQGHHVQGFGLYNGGFIHYGLGNLFFDQMDQLGTRQTFVDVYTIYDGRLLNVDLWTGLIENYARPRTMTPAEREQALRAVFQASGW